MVLTPQMAISHLVMTIGVGISQKKISKILTMFKYCGMTHIISIRTRMPGGVFVTRYIVTVTRHVSRGHNLTSQEW